MAFRLSEMVVCGEIINTRKNCVHGWLGLRDREERVPLNLTGNCDPDLAGKHIRFQVRQPTDPARGEPTDLSGLANQQIGPTGTMTAARRVRVSDDSPEQLYRRARLGEMPPLEWKPCLYLEWFSQNGRVVVELIDPEIEFVEGDTAPMADGTLQSEAPDEIGGYITIVRSNTEPAADMGEGETENQLDDLDFLENIPDTNAGDEAEDDTDDNNADDEESDDEDPYGLFSDELKQQFESAGIPGIEGEDREALLHDFELMDSLLERGEDVPVGSIFDPPIQLPPADRLDDAEVEEAFKMLLARLAQYGIALDMCEHFTPRAAYRLLVERICREEGAFPELRQTQWVQHFMTHDFCPECSEIVEKQLEDMDLESGNSSDDDADDDDSPAGDKSR